MLLTIRGVHLPGSHVNVHVGLQVSRDPTVLVPGDAPGAGWTVPLCARAGLPHLTWARA